MTSDVLMAVPCPRCKAKRAEPCVRMAGFFTSWRAQRAHASRINAAFAHYVRKMNGAR